MPLYLMMIDPSDNTVDRFGPFDDFDSLWDHVAEYDVDQDKELLRTTGWSPGEDGMRQLLVVDSMSPLNTSFT